MYTCRWEKQMHKNYRKLHVYTGSHLGLHSPAHPPPSPCLSVPVTLTTVAVNAPLLWQVSSTPSLQLLQRCVSIRVKWEWTSWVVERALPGWGRGTFRLVGRSLVSVRKNEQHLHTSQIQHVIHTTEYVSSLSFRMAFNSCPQVIWDNYRQNLAIMFTQ